MVRGDVSSFVMTAFDFINSREMEGITVAVTAAVALACADTLCGAVA
jgi:hypothetical protein